MDRPQMDRGRHVRRAAGRATQEERHARGTRKKGRRLFFFFLGRRSGDAFFTFWVATVAGAQLSRPWGIGPAAKTLRAQLRHGVEKPSLQRTAACGRHSSLSSLYTLDTYAGAQSGRNGWMSVFSSLCIYSISQILAVVKNGKWKKMEGIEKSGRRGIAGKGD